MFIFLHTIYLRVLKKLHIVYPHIIHYLFWKYLIEGSFHLRTASKRGTEQERKTHIMMASTFYSLILLNQNPWLFLRLDLRLMMM